MRVELAILFFITLLIPNFSCNYLNSNKYQNTSQLEDSVSCDAITDSATKTDGIYQDATFDRVSIVKQLKRKKDNHIPLSIHIYVPLCDNKNQNIVPTTQTLGNGLNLRTNLYWAVKGSVKYDFVRSSDWVKVYNAFDIDSNVLERIVFERDYADAKVYIIADAYRGDRMEEAVNDFLASIANCRNEMVMLDTSKTVGCAGNSDLIIFNGHNGMMDDIHVKEWVNETNDKTDVVINACATYYHFQDELAKAKGYPIVRSNTLLHPGAYVLTQIIDDWVRGVQADTICINAGKAYCRVHKCSVDAEIYTAGW